MTTSDISKFTKIQQSKVYEIINNLSLKTIIEVSSENGHKKFKAVEPNHAIKMIIEQKEKDVKTMKDKGSEIVKIIKKKTVPIENNNGIWISDGKKEFLEKCSLMLNRAEKYAYGITESFSRTSHLDDEIVAAAKRGVRVRGIGIGELKDLSKERAKWYSSRKVDIRMTKLDIHPKICLVDGKEVCLRIDNENNSEFIWSDNPGMVNFVKSYFENLWQDAKKYR
jgi:sugar-specific transcriptional regulator TrmB